MPDGPCTYRWGKCADAKEGRHVCIHQHGHGEPHECCLCDAVDFGCKHNEGIRWLDHGGNTRCSACGQVVEAA